MRAAVWMLLGAWGTAIGSALAARSTLLHVLPDLALIVLVFLAMRREAPEVAASALVLGFVMGTLALAPPGLHEAACALVALGVFLVTGSLAGAGAGYFALVVGTAEVALHVTLALLAMAQHMHVGFSSLATALLLPQALLTSGLAWALYGALQRLDAWLSPRAPEGLQWH
jgi:hypothetical protein